MTPVETIALAAIELLALVALWLAIEAGYLN